MPYFEIYVEGIKRNIEGYIVRKKEEARVGRMDSHPHVPGCDMTGDIIVSKTDRNIGGGTYEPRILGMVTECTSCGKENGTGTLR